MHQFAIADHVDFLNGRASCPNCEAVKGQRNKNLSLVPNTDGAYKCFRGCTPEEIRNALGIPKTQQIPAALAATTPQARVTVSPQKVKEAHDNLMTGQNIAREARDWLIDRGITAGMMERYQLGIVRAKVGTNMLPALSIPLPNADGTAFYQKKRIAPWLPESDRPPEYQPWTQKGIPARVWFTWLPSEAKETWLCEGEWDAMLLGQQLRERDESIAVACFTCGCQSIPPADQLALLPGTITTWYDRDQPGEDGARKLAAALGQRAKIATVPMPEDCQVKGWDVSDALNNGYEVRDFLRAAESAVVAIAPEPTPKRENPLRSRLQWNDDLLDTAPDHTEWLVSELLTADELFLLASCPRAGKSLFAMTLALSVASGEPFLGRPVTQGTVIYIRCEDNPAKTKEREQAQGWTRGLPVVWLDKFKLSELPYLREIALELDPRLIVFDTLSRIKDSSISESSAEMSQLLEPLQELASEIGCCVLLVHHTGKVSVDNANQVDPFETIRGSSAIRAVCRGSMILAAGDRNMRLLVENGWGKHDLNIALDANTLQWRLIGHWNQTMDGSQKERIVSFLKTVQETTIDAIFDALDIPRKSIHKVLERLQVSDIAEEKVVKTGKRRNYTYRLALFDMVSLFDKSLLVENLSNSPNPDADSDRGSIRQNLSFFRESGSIIDRAVTEPCDSECDNPRSIQPVSIDPSPGGFLSNREGKTGSKPRPEADFAIRQQFDNNSTVELERVCQFSIDPSIGGTNELLGSIESDQGSIDARNHPISVGDLVEILTGQFTGKRGYVEAISADGLVAVKAEGWYVMRQYPGRELKRLRQFKRRGDSNAHG